LITYREEEKSPEIPGDRQSSPLGIFHRRGDVVANRYKILGILGQGGVATTYEAENDAGEVVALKAMSLRSMKGWKVGE
jgi:serine/threonine protein kinase